MLTKYLDTSNYGYLEGRLLALHWLAPILTPDEIHADGLMSKYATVVDVAVCKFAISKRIAEPINFAIVDSEVLNAFASRVNDVHCIVLSRAFFVNLVAMFLALSSTPSFCRLYEIDSPDVSNPTLAASPNWLAHEMSRIPSTDLQKSIAVELAYGSINAIVYHELTHISNGHLSLDVGGTNIGSRLEIDGSRILTHEQVLVSQCIEWDADCGAISMMVDDTNFVRPDSWIGVRNVFVASLALWRLFDRSLAGPVWDRSHPPAKFRMIASGATVEARLAVWAKRKAGQFQSLWEHWCEKQDEYQRLYIQAEYEAGAPPIYSEWNEAGLARLRDIEQTWSNIRPYLDRHKIGQHTLAS